jgi:hypothetical protein
LPSEAARSGAKRARRDQRRRREFDPRKDKPMAKTISLLQRAPKVLALMLTLLGLSHTPTAAAEGTVVNPYGDASVDVYLVTAFDPGALIVRDVALTVRKSDGACSVGVFPSNEGGGGWAIYRSGGGNDHIAFWEDPNWSVFNCGAFSMFVRTFGLGGGGMPAVFAGGGDDIVIDHPETRTLVYLEDGGDIAVMRGTGSQAEGGPGGDVLYAQSNNVFFKGDADGDLFCLGDHNIVGGNGGDGFDLQAGGPTKLLNVELHFSGACPPPPQ